MLYKVVSEISVPGIVKLCHPVDVTRYPYYSRNILKPMDLGIINEKIRREEYASTAALLADINGSNTTRIFSNTI